jgi:hypothetical protein
MRPQLSRAAAVISSSETPASAARSTPLLTLSALRAIAATAFWLGLTASTRPPISGAGEDPIGERVHLVGDHYEGAAGFPPAR